jgi:hypothetical protein
MLLGISEARPRLIVLLQTILILCLSLVGYLKSVPYLKPCMLAISCIYFCLLTALILCAILCLTLGSALSLILGHTTGTGRKC